MDIIISIPRIRGAPDSSRFRQTMVVVRSFSFPGRRGKWSSQRRIEEDRVGITDAGQDDE
jgi:hypothetical protein